MKKRLKILALVVLSLVVLLGGGLWLYLYVQESETFEGELADLLPPNTSAYVTVRELSALRDDLKQTQMLEQFIADDPLMEALFSGERWQKYKQELNEVGRKFQAQLLEQFVDRYFGQETSAALVRYEADRPPALFLITQTNLGFQEQVAELCAHLYPELELVEQRYNGVRISTYQREKSKRSFSYFRYGRTVILSLRSDDSSYLKRLIDSRDSGTTNTLSNLARFRESMEGVRQQRGAIMYINPDRFAQDLRDVQGSSMGQKMAEPRYAALKRFLERFRTANLSLTYDDRLELRLELRDPQKASEAALTTASAGIEDFELAPRDSAMALATSNVSLAKNADAIARWIRLLAAGEEDEPDDETDTKEILKRRLKQMLTSGSGSALLKRLDAVLGDESVLILEKVQPGLLLPRLEFAAVSRRGGTSQTLQQVRELVGDRRERVLPNETEKEVRQWQLMSYNGVPLIQPLFITLAGERVFIGSSADDYRRLPAVAERHEASLVSNPVFADAWREGGGESTALLFVNFQELRRQLAFVQAGQVLGNDKVEEFFETYDPYIRGLSYLRGALLQAQLKADGSTYYLTVPVK